MSPSENGAIVLGELIPHAVRESTEHDGQCQSCFTRFFVLTIHVFGRLSQCLNGGIEIDPMSRSDLVAGDRIRSPRLHSAERAPFDTRNLDVAGHWIAG